MLNLSQSALLGILHDAVNGTLSNVKLDLFSSYDGTPNPTTSNFTLPSYSGNAAISTVSFTGPRVWADGTEGYFAHEQFQATNATPQLSDTVQGYFLTSGGNVVAWEAFPVPQPMLNADSFCEFDIRLTVDPTTNFGSASQE